MKRIFAWLGILFILLAFLALITAAFTGASANTILAILFCMLVIPVMLYAYLLILKIHRRGQEEEKDKSDS